MHYRNERNLTAMLSHPAYLFLQGLVALFSLPFKSLSVVPLVGIFSPGLGNDEPERTKLGQSLARTDKFISQSSLFIEAGTKSLEYMASRARMGLRHNQ